VAKFVWQMNVRRGLRAASKDSGSLSPAASVGSGIGQLIDFDRDFNVPDTYEGPRLDIADGELSNVAEKDLLLEIACSQSLLLSSPRNDPIPKQALFPSS